jgi:hypothetical protein
MLLTTLLLITRDFTFSFFHFQILNDMCAGCTLCIKCGNLISKNVPTSVPTEPSIPLRYLNRNISHCHLLSLSITTSTMHDAIKNVYNIYYVMWKRYIISKIQAARMKHVKVCPVSVP